MHILKAFRSPKLYLIILPALQIVLESDSLSVNLKEEENSPTKNFDYSRKANIIKVRHQNKRVENFCLTRHR